MKKFAFIANMMMEMCMQNGCICMVCRAFRSDMFSVSGVKHIAA